MRKLAVLGLVVGGLLAGSGCLPNRYIKKGDAAAARGDWRAAEKAYRAAINKEPSNIELARKYGDAKPKAIAEALRVAASCQAQGDRDCVDGELEYVLIIDPGNQEATKFQVAQREAQATELVARARSMLQAGRPLSGLQELEKLPAQGLPAEVVEAAAALERELVAKAAEIAGQLLARAKQEGGRAGFATLTDALALAQAAVQRDTSHGALHQQIVQLRGELAAEEVKALNVEAELALGREDFDAAATSLAKVQELQPSASAAGRLAYARAMATAQVAVRQRDFQRATDALRPVAGGAADTGGKAQALLEAVEPRVYRIRVESVAISPNKPGTNTPWVGKDLIDEIAPIAIGAAASVWVSPVGGKVASDVAKVMFNPKNMPELTATFLLPDGRTASIKAKKGLYAALGAEMYLISNHYDRRRLRMNLSHGYDNEGVADANVELGQLVRQQVDGTSVDGNLAALRQVVFTAEPADPWLDGALVNLALADRKENEAAPAARATASRDRVRLQLVSVQVNVPTEGGDGDNSDPDLYLILESATPSAGQLLRTTVAQDKRQARWSFAMTDLFVAPNEKFSLVLKDADLVDHDEITRQTITGAELMSGDAVFRNAAGTTVTFQLQRRADRPQ